MLSSQSSASIAFSIEPLPSLEALERTWTQLDTTGPHSFFLTWAWIGTWLRCLPCPPETMLLRATRDGETVALAVLTMKRVTRTFMPVRQALLNATGDPAYDNITIEHNGFASSSTVQTHELWNAFINSFADGDLSVDELVFANVQSSDLRRAAIPVEHREYGFRVPLADSRSIDAFMLKLSRNGRQQLRRSIRSYQREGPLSIERAEDVPMALAFFTEMKKLHVASWTRRNREHSFVKPFFETFHRSFIRHNVAGGNVDMLRVSAGDRVIGYLYNFSHNGIVSNYQTGFDDVDRRMRPGYVCHALAITHYASAGMSSYDLLGGTNQLKQSFGSERYELNSYRLHKKVSRRLLCNAQPDQSATLTRVNPRVGSGL